jgi:hypothetical protein
MAQPQVQAQPQPNTRLAEEADTSQKKSSDEAIKAIYKMISKYNGIVRRIIETIEPVKGPWSTRKSVDQSTISYYAQVLKGLLEPLKHLMFQLAKTNDPVLSSMVNMIDNMIKMIDMAPPFSMIDSSAYKQGTFDYTGLNDDLSVGNLDDYINLLTLRMKTLKNTRDQYDTSNPAYLATLPKDRRADIKQLIDKTYKEADLVMEKTAEEIKKAKQMKKDKLLSFELNKKVLDGLEISKTQLDKIFLPIAGKSKEDMTTSEVNNLYNGLASATKIFDKQDAKKMNDIKEELKAVKKRIDALTKIGTKNGTVEFDINELKNTPGQAEEYSKLLNRATRLEKDWHKGDIGKAAGICGTGIDVNVVQQYNTMGRPVSNDQKINNDMINANRNWQIKNNPPHDTPIGNLNPFLAQDDASKYTYEVMLAKQNAEIHPEVNALGANISLLQGPITNMSGSGKKSKAMDKISKVAIDEKNDMFKPMEVGDKGYIPEEKEDQFKLPDLKPKKKK